MVTVSLALSDARCSPFTHPGLTENFNYCRLFMLCYLPLCFGLPAAILTLEPSSLPSSGTTLEFGVRN
jgi:hypothetical protein